uniref:Uncharacterized protein n=1 Tax=Anguilla anguilla TaxID=7936 RepID=A0A0E9QWP6_ANGAN
MTDSPCGKRPFQSCSRLIGLLFLFFHVPSIADLLF